MANADEITVQVNVEGLLQQELVKFINRVHKDHGVMIESIDFEWVKKGDGSGKVISCKIHSNYYT